MISLFCMKIVDIQQNGNGGHRKYLTFTNHAILEGKSFPSLVLGITLDCTVRGERATSQRMGATR